MFFQHRILAEGCWKTKASSLQTLENRLPPSLLVLWINASTGNANCVCGYSLKTCRKLVENYSFTTQNVHHGTCMHYWWNFMELDGTSGSRSCAKTLWFTTENVQASWNSPPPQALIRQAEGANEHWQDVSCATHCEPKKGKCMDLCNNRRLVLIGCLSPHIRVGPLTRTHNFFVFVCAARVLWGGGAPAREWDARLILCSFVPLF